MSKGGDKTPPRLGVPGGGRGVDEGRDETGEGDAMSDVVIRFKKLRPEAVLPTKHTPSDAGFDLHAAEDFEIWSGEALVVPTGLASEIPPGFFCQVRGRSSLARRGLDVLAGVIDPLYKGEWGVVLSLNGGDEVYVKAGDRIAQFVVLPVPAVEIVEVQELGGDDRGGGWGSSGR